MEGRTVDAKTVAVACASSVKHWRYIHWIGHMGSERIFRPYSHLHL